MSPKVSFNSIKREQRYYKFKLDVYRERRKEGNRPGPRGDPTRGGSPKNFYRLFHEDMSYHKVSLTTARK